MYSSGAGDDIGALVCDIGSFSSRIGFAGDDMPKANSQTVRFFVSYFYFSLVKISKKSNITIENMKQDG